MTKTHKKLTALVAALAIGGLAAPASAVLIVGDAGLDNLIDFDDQAAGTLVGAGDYASQGVASIIETEGVGSFARYSFAGGGSYVGTGPTGDRGDDSSGWDGTIDILFDGLTDAIGITIANSAFLSEMISVYDSGSNLLESYVVPDGSVVDLGIQRASSDIALLRITGGFFAIDNLQFNDLVAVPEPGSMALLGLGLLGAGAMRRRRGAR